MAMAILGLLDRKRFRSMEQSNSKAMICSNYGNTNFADFADAKLPLFFKALSRR